MTVKTNYHIHTSYCDGASTFREYIETALERGFDSIGFSSHAPLPFETDWNMKAGRLGKYKDEIMALKKEYAGRLEIYYGLEIDFIPGVIDPHSPELLITGLEYSIGSVHFLGQTDSGKYWTVDGPYEELMKGIEHSFHGDAKLAAGAYYDMIIWMVTECPPDIVGHLDLIKRHNGDGRLFLEQDDWYRRTVAATIESIAASSCVLEINTGGIGRAKIDSLYPSPWIIEEAFRKNVPVTINSDAHDESQFNAYYEETVRIVKKAGYRKIMRLCGGEWISSELP